MIDPQEGWPAYLPAGYTRNRPINGGPGTLRPDHASQQVGNSFQPGSSGSQETERAKTSLLGLIVENWIPFTAWITSRFIAPRPPQYAFSSPVDVNAAETITRFGTFPSAERLFPWPYMIGAVSADMPMLDQYSMAWAWGKTPSGPGVLTPIPIPWDTDYPTLPKVSG